MRISRLSVLAVALAMSVAAPGTAAAKPAKAKAKAKPVVENPASPEKINALKGAFKWGMLPEEVIAKIKEQLDARFDEKAKAALLDATLQDRIRTEKRSELNAVKKSYVKFEDKTPGWDVSIVDQEFGHNSGEAMLFTKEDLWTRYFFFFDNRLYKMFFAFNKDALRGKGFKDFADKLQSDYGKARELWRETKEKGATKRVLDGYTWTSLTSDSLKLVDRSEFYDVFCLVMYETSTNDRVMEHRKLSASSGDGKDSIVDAVVAKDGDGRDSNDNIIDRFTGKDIQKPGNEPRHADIVVPSVRGPTAAEVNTGGSRSGSKGAKGKKEKDESKPVVDGLEL